MAFFSDVKNSVAARASALLGTQRGARSAIEPHQDLAGGAMVAGERGEGIRPSGQGNRPADQRGGLRRLRADPGAASAKSAVE